MASIPDRLRVNGRLPDQSFAENEYLYIRCRADQVDGNHLTIAAIKFPDWSTNRQKYSEPEDVLLPDFAGWGIARFKVGNIPKRKQSGDSKTYTFRPVHDPLPSPTLPDDPPENYSHTEVRTFKDGVFDDGLKVSTIIKKEFRTQLSAFTEVIREPSQPAPTA